MSNITNLEQAAAELARKKKSRPTSAPDELYDANGRRIIRHNPSQLPAVLDALELALSETDALHLFRYAGRLARVYQADEQVDSNVKRPAGVNVVHPVEPPHLAELATRAALHEKWDSRRSDYTPIDCPRRVAEAFLRVGRESCEILEKAA